MAFVLNISHAPLSPLAEAPLYFARAATADIKACFFQGEAVTLFADTSANPGLKQAWLDFLKEQELTALCCSAAASALGELQPTQHQAAIEIVGLGELISLSQQAKIICFGDA